MADQSMPNDGMQKLYDSKFRFSMLGATLAIGGVFGICSSMLFLLGVVTVAGLTVAPLVPIIVASLSLCAEIGGVIILWIQRRSTLSEFAEFANQKSQTLPPVNHGDSAELNALKTENEKLISANKISNFQLSHLDIYSETRSAIDDVGRFCENYDNKNPKKPEDLKNLKAAVTAALDKLSGAIDGSGDQLGEEEKTAVLAPIRQAAGRLVCHDVDGIDPNVKPELVVYGGKVYRLGSNWQCQLCCANILNGEDGAMVKFMSSLKKIMESLTSYKSGDLSIQLSLFLGLFSCFQAIGDGTKNAGQSSVSRISASLGRLFYGKISMSTQCKCRNEVFEKFAGYQTAFAEFASLFPCFQVRKVGLFGSVKEKEIELVNFDFTTLQQDSARDMLILINSNDFADRRQELSKAVENVRKSEAAIWELLTQAEPPAPTPAPEQSDT
jgi:hypothetical protein